MENYQVRTLKCEGRVNSPRALGRIEEVLSLLAEIHDGCLYLFRLTERQDPDRYNNCSLQQELKQLRAEIPEFASLSRKLQEGAVKRAAASWSRYKKDRKAGQPPSTQDQEHPITASLNGAAGRATHARDTTENFAII